MTRNEPRRAVSDKLISQDDGEAANDEFDETDFERGSAAYYERRRKMWAKFNEGDWWIAIGLYLILASVAFVAL